MVRFPPAAPRARVSADPLAGQRLEGEREVLERTTLSRTTLFRLERAGDFPRSIRISENRVAYDADAVDGWIEALRSGGPE